MMIKIDEQFNALAVYINENKDLNKNAAINTLFNTSLVNDA